MRPHRVLHAPAKEQGAVRPTVGEIFRLQGAAELLVYGTAVRLEDE